LEAERVPRSDQGYVTPKWRTFWLMVGFAVLVGIGVVTVLRPEFEDDPNGGDTAEMEPSEEPKADELLQE
jgi:hypothetical protein